MLSFDKTYLDRLAAESGFIRDNLGRILQFSESEHDFVAHFNRREYRPEILFGPGDIAERVINHPMALWKCRPANA